MWVVLYQLSKIREIDTNDDKNISSTDIICKIVPSILGT